MSPSWQEVNELLELERSAARRDAEWDLFIRREDEIEEAAARSLRAYRLLGGMRAALTLPTWRARVRELLSIGNRVAA
jgi:hypothetical protein